MVAKTLLAGALALPPKERLELLEGIWASFVEQPDTLPLSDEHAEELDRRLVDEIDHPDQGSPAEEVLERLSRREF